MRFTTSLLRWVAPAALAFSSLCVTATGYPDKPVKLVVPFPAGGPTDALARLIGQHLSQQLGQPFVVDNRGGAGGTIATEAAARPHRMAIRCSSRRLGRWRSTLRCTKP
ncbi:Bug family tripartite tricarboxylate transporter substrate binding protein [Cupriavidus basilensis]